MTAIDPRHLRIFLAVCRAGSISGAARVLGMAQPSVSVTIAQLERTIGSPLFTRGRTGIVLERAGTVLLRRAEALESLLNATAREMALMADDVAGPLVIGGTPGALASLVPDTLARLTIRHPQVDVRILERPDDQLIALLRSERIDLAVATTGLDDRPDDIEETSILQDPFDLIVGRKNEALPTRVRLREVADRPWVLPDAAGAFRRQIDALFLATQTPLPRALIRCDSLLTTKAIVQNSDHVTILPRGVAAAELHIGMLRAIEIEGAHFPRNVGLLRLTARPIDTLVQALIDAAISGRNID